MSLPKALRQTPQWLVSGSDKAPVSPKTGRYADVRDSSLYVPYADAIAYAEKHGMDVGFALTRHDPFAVIDLDQPDNEQQATRHSKILDAFGNTYSELSRSGKGVHIWCYGRVPQGARRDKVEVYSDSRYMICTGIPVRPLPITDQNHLLNVLFQEISSARLNAAELYEVDSTMTDREVFEMGARAENSDKFLKLTNGQWEGDYPSQSEADYALMNFLCFYSRSNEQCRRIFRMTPLGKRDKARRDKYLDYMIEKIRAEQPEPIDFSEILHRNGTEIPKPTSQVPAPVTKQPKELDQDAPITYPPGLVGEIAQYIYASSTRPVAETSISAALAMCSGILGRHYNISNTGLNQYIILLAKTGAGKEGGPSGIQRLLHAVREIVPAVDTFVGPGHFASGQGLIRALDDQHCFFSILGEFGLTLQQLSDSNTSSHLIVLRRVLLDLYTKSGKTAMIYSSAYSDRDKNTKTLSAPAVTIYGEATPETFYAGLSEQHIADGLIPRFLILEYKGNRPNRNPGAHSPPSPELVEKVGRMTETVLRMMNNQTWQDVVLSPEAKAIMDAFDRDCDRHIRQGHNDAIRQLYNRGHLKALRLAAVLAAADRHHMPVVNEVEATWAVDLVRRDLQALTSRFESGDVGEGLSKQLADTKRALGDYIERDVDDLESYGVTQDMKNKLVVPYVYLQRRLVNLAAFRKDRRGTKNAIRDVLQELQDAEIIVEVPKQQVKEEFGRRGKMYHIIGSVEE